MININAIITDTQGMHAITLSSESCCSVDTRAYPTKCSFTPRDDALTLRSQESSAAFSPQAVLLSRSWATSCAQQLFLVLSVSSRERGGGLHV